MAIVKERSWLRRNWWKVLAVLLLAYVLPAALLLPAPRLAILNETIRNLHFHVSMWFGMVLLLTGACVYSIIYLKKGAARLDAWAAELSNAGFLLGILGLLTGMIWANWTWGEPWSGDAKQNNTAIALLIYAAYLILRAAVPDPLRRARLAAVFNIFAYATLVPLLFIIPRMSPDSLHPGVGGNPGFDAYDLDSRLRVVFYPAVIGWTLLALWLANLRVRTRQLENI